MNGHKTAGVRQTLFLLALIALISMILIGSTIATKMDDKAKISRPNRRMFEELLEIKKIDDFFRIEDLNYFNVSISNSKNITISLKRIPNIIEYDVNSTNELISTKIFIENLKPLQKYYLYENSYRNLKVFQTDSRGTFVYSQDLSKPYHIWIQPTPSTIFISDDVNGGDCEGKSIGNWNVTTKTCTLTTNLNESIELESTDITLNCNLYSIIGSGTGYGVYANSKHGIAIKNCKISNFYKGIYILNSNGILISDNNTSLNDTTGISLKTVNDSFINKNISSNNRYGIYLYTECSRNSITNNTTGGNGQAGIVVIDSSNNNTIRNNESNTEVYDAIRIVTNSSGNIVTNNKSFFNNNCIVLGNEANENIVTDNLCEGRDSYDNGIGIYDSLYNVLKNNNCSSFQYSAIELDDSNHNILISNKLQQAIYGVSNYKSSNNIISNNEITKATIGIKLMHWSNDNTISNNTITNNETGIGRNGIFPSTGPSIGNIITYNDIYNNSGYNFENKIKGDVMAEKNWWGTTNESTIAAKIYDYYEEVNYGIVDYIPWLNESKRFSLAIVSPTDLPPFTPNETMNIRFEIKANGNYITLPQIEYKLRGNAPWIPVSLSGVGVYSFSVQVPSTEGNYALILKANVDEARIVDSITYSVEERDLYIEWIKPIQVVEDVPLVAGKATVVRVKVVNNGPETDTDVSVNYGNGCFTKTEPATIPAYSSKIVDFYPPNECTHI